MKRWFAILFILLALAAGCQPQTVDTAIPTFTAAVAPPAQTQPTATVEPVATAYPAATENLAATAYPGEEGTGGMNNNPPGGADGLWLAYPPAPNDAQMERGNFFVDAATLMPVAGQAGQTDLYVEGSLPTPCHQLRLLANPPDDQNRIVVEVYTVSDPQMMCTQVIQPFAGKVATLGGYSAGTYTVVVNEVEAGTISMP